MGGNIGRKVHSFLRIVTYNVEWFSNLFDRNGKLLRDGKWSARRDVTRKEQANAIAHVLKKIDADCVLIVEAPDTNSRSSTEEALRTFARHYNLRINSVVTGYLSDTQQEIALMYDPTIISAIHDPKGDDNPESESPRFDLSFKKDITVDGEPETFVFSKPPLELEIKVRNGPRIRLIGVHIKSKAPHGAKNKQDEIRIAIQNRQKQLAQSLWLRTRIDQHLSTGENLIVLGDFNDGPGLDEYEQLFGHSSVDIVFAEDAEPEFRLYDPHVKGCKQSDNSWIWATARFYDYKRQLYINALLDFILTSPGLKHYSPKWKIWHPFDNPQCYNDTKLRSSLLAASDHFPVMLDLEL